MSSAPRSRSSAPLLLFVPLLFIAISCGPNVVVGSSWTADTGIYGTYDHFGNPPNGPAAFLCGVGYDLHFRGTLPLESVRVAVRYAAAFVARAGLGPSTSGTDGWVWDTTSLGSSTASVPAQVGHVSGAIGTICPDGAGDLESLRGSILRVEWRERGADHLEDIVVDRVRGGLKVTVGAPSSDGLPQLEWER